MCHAAVMCLAGTDRYPLLRAAIAVARQLHYIIHDTGHLVGCVPLLAL
jgi:hypothetical protein